MATTIRAKIDGEITRHVGKWFTVRKLQNKLRLNPSTLKPLIMKYAREKVLRRRPIKGTARSVEFSPAANSTSAFVAMLEKNTPYRNFTKSSNKKIEAKKSIAAKSKMPSPKKASKKASKSKK